ncbi:DNA-binding protein [Paenibacillus sp. B2(2019)]|uniref:DNA-binding protein n=1 Tax=Paenibacillus sp. B2(2019) TaxID=2607754 RepID=UPI0011F192AC|nr:DNA-binding protein [Paenibacillus sp. B2(2019)]
MDLDGLNADSLTSMLKASFSLENWGAMIEIADRLITQIAFIYETSSDTLREQNLKRSIPYYFGFSLCSKGIALQKLGKYPEARMCIQKYAELGWIKGLDDEGINEVKYYCNIAKANTYVLDLLEGQTGVLKEYVEFIRNSAEEELLPGLITILESSIKYNYSVDWILSEFEINANDIGARGTQESIRYFVDYKFLLAMYYYKQENMCDAINTILETLLLSIKLKDDTGFKKAAALFEILRDYANQSQLQVHHNIMETIIERELTNEKENVLAYSRSLN